MIREIDNYFLQQSEPLRSYLDALRTILLNDEAFSEAWKYRMPFYCINGKMACYLWVDKKTKWPYLGIVEGVEMKDPELVQQKRARMKILLLNPEKDIPVRKIKSILSRVKKLYGM